MDKEVIVRLHADFEDMTRTFPGSDVEFWCARDLQELLGYVRWENFAKVVEKATIACEKSGESIEHHFRAITKMIDLGKGGKRAIDDIALTRYACYLVAQNGDPAKEPIAFAQTYFAVQTRKQEVIMQRLAEAERVSARKKLTKSEKELSGIIYERVGDEKSFARIRSKGDQALFGGRTTRDMKHCFGVPEERPLADFLPTITIKAKDFASEITNYNIKQQNLSTEGFITDEHVKNNEEVRKLLRGRGIVPEKLPPDEDVKKVERRLQSEQKRLSKGIKRFQLPPESNSK